MVKTHGGIDSKKLMGCFEKFEKKNIKKKNIASGRIVDFKVMKEDSCDIRVVYSSGMDTVATCE